jgi:hypothetical protein
MHVKVVVENVLKHSLPDYGTATGMTRCTCIAVTKHSF